MNAKNTLRALITSFLALTLCLSMLVGTTYAWFTDSVTTGVNTIQSGSLDVDMVDRDGKSFAGRTLAFRNEGGNDDILWEPGAKFALDAFQVVNKGNLALKYQIFINGLTGNSELLDVITFTVKVGDANEITLAGFNTNFGEGADNHLSPAGKEGDKSSLITIYGEMDPKADNKYQDMILDGISITVYATQYTEESDSFGNQYDAAATYLNKDENGNWLISNAAELLYFAKTVNTSATNFAYKNETVLLTADIDLGGMEWTPIGNLFNSHEFGGRFDGQGHTISNFTVDNKAGAALFGFVRYSGCNDTNRPWIKNLTVKNVTATGGDYVAGVVGQLYGTIDNCHAINVNVTATPFLKADGKTYDGGAKAGGVIGWMESGDIYQASNCTATNVTISAYRDLGGVLGMAHEKNVITGLKTYGAVLSYVSIPAGAAYDSNTPSQNMGPVVGRVQSTAVVTESYHENVIMVSGAVYVSTLAELQSALDSATDGANIVFTADIVGDSTVTQPSKENVSIVIEGNGHKYDGQISIKAGSSNGTDVLVIKNINFETNTSGRDFVWSAYSASGSDVRYAHNITIENCTFTAVEGSAAVHTAVGARFQQCYNIKLVNCTATNLHSLLQAESCGSTVTVDGCKVINGKNGVSFNNTMNAVISNTEIEAVGSGSYGIRHKGQVNNYALTVENCKVKAFVPVLVRNLTGTGYTATFKGTNTLTVNGSNPYQVVLSNVDYDGTQALVKPTGTYTLTGADGFSVYKG